MKKILSILLAAMMVCSLAACSDSKPNTSSTPDSSSESSSEPGTDSSSEPEGEVDPATDPVGETASFESADLGIRFDYPADWFELSAETFNQPEILAELEEITGMSADVMSDALSQVNVILYNFEESTETMAPCLNLVAADAGGATFADLSSSLAMAQLKVAFDAQYRQMFEGFAWVAEPTLTTYGENQFITMQCSYTMADEEILTIQAMGIENDKMYTFTYTLSKDTFTDAILATLGGVYGSIQYSA